MPKIRFELQRRHSDSKNIDSDSKNSYLDSKNLNQSFWSSSNYKTTKTLMDMVWSWFRIICTPRTPIQSPKDYNHNLLDTIGCPLVIRKISWTPQLFCGFQMNNDRRLSDWTLLNSMCICLRVCVCVCVFVCMDYCHD